MSTEPHCLNEKLDTPIPLGLGLLTHKAPYLPRRRWLGTRSYWLCQALGWGGLFLLLSGPLPLKARTSGAELAAILLFTLSGLLVSHLLRVSLVSALDQARPRFSFLLRTLPCVFLGLVGHVSLQLYWARAVLPHQTVFLSAHPGMDPLLYAFTDIFCLSAGVFGAWLSLYFGLLSYRQFQAARIERLELAAQVQEAAWQALREQLNPHFLFNSLNSILALIPRDQPAPRKALLHLSELLRSSLSLNQNELIPLSLELETVDSYVALETLRFEERLRVSRHITPGLTHWQVPPFLVQILMENAVKYGVAPFVDGGDIHLEIRQEGERLVIEVSNRGQKGQAPAERSTGLGLQNLRSRLALLFGPTAGLSLENQGADKVLARALIPARRLPSPLLPSAPNFPTRS